MITNELLAFAIEQEYKEAIHWKNFWVGFKNINGDGVQVVDSEIIEWELQDEQPANLAEITDRWSLEFERYQNSSAIPQSISMRQARLMLSREGSLSAVQEAIDLLPESQREEAQIEWDYAQMVNRDNPIMQLIAQKIGLTDEQLDEMFLEASKL
jgi:hypothetical protein